MFGMIFVLVFVLIVFLVGVRGRSFVTVDFDTFFWTYLYNYYTWWAETSGVAFLNYNLAFLLKM